MIEKIASKNEHVASESDQRLILVSKHHDGVMVDLSFTLSMILTQKERRKMNLLPLQQ